jgi:DNA-directed RNA polymerase subunit RPC12/RpoP
MFPYLYNCAECGAKVKVKVRGETVEVRRTCNHANAVVNAPRRVLLTGDGTMSSLPWRIRLAWKVRVFLSWLTGRCV